ncbi:class II glutamine amidotransferase [Roseateles sp.]|uniref:class II glutamine amidotransferase n=1 Tax=Roseateles sp. TaxID=1971397 RepID=UPI00286C75A9|nr:class II glutamine amidotransferase [Roseateles sp.]
MRELFAISTKNPSTIQMALVEFSRHGGLSAPHKDGLGIAWYERLEGKQLRLI